jgi:hypothetical protein
MAFDKERETIAQIVDGHGNAPLTPEFATPVARSIARTCMTLKIKPPLAISRFLDRADGPKGRNGAQDKLARDLHGKDYSELPEDKQQEIDSKYNSIAMSNPATGHSYLKPGFTFGQGHNLMLAAIREESIKGLPQEVRAGLSDFVRALEKDLDEAAKHAGFYKSYADANTALKIATAGPHRAGQSIPIVTARR